MIFRVIAIAAAVAVIAVGAYLVFSLAQPSGLPPDRAAEIDRAAVPSSSTAPRERDPEPERSRSTSPRVARRASAEAAPPLTPVPVESAPGVGTLRIETDVPGAQVFIDRQFIGTAPVTAESLKPGTHQLNVSAEGFDGIARAIDVEPGERDLMIRFREVRLHVKLAVVHKHRMGSCTGQLVATANGIRYETADQDDRFEVPLGDLETFLVDYQDKNLRIKLRRGKQYNFTEPEGIADRLLVFHRDVDKARQRVAKGEQPATD